MTQSSPNKNRPPGLFDRIYDMIQGQGVSFAPDQDNRQPLQEAAQLALQVEFTTIPAYLTALYSISQLDSTAYQLLRSVVMEEMFHFNLAANILVSIGGLPRCTGPFVPHYPGYLPHANPDTTPYVGLYRASIDVFENVFAAIERPAPAHAPAQGDNYSTIAQLYEALVDGMEWYVAKYGEAALFTPNPDGRQRTHIYLGKFGGTVIEVTNLKSAKLAVDEIVEQGEGSVPSGEPLVPVEPWSTYNAYGTRTDGTYGPILGVPFEMSHFSKFRKIALDAANFPSTYPIISNVRMQDLSNPTAVKKAKMFDVAYSVMLDALESSFRKPSHEGIPDPFFALVLPLMHQVMPNLARNLMTTPAQADGDSGVGPNAAPMFLYQPNANVSDLTGSIRRALGAAEIEERETLEAAFAAALDIAAAIQPDPAS